MTHELFPFTYEDAEEIDETTDQFYDVMFTSNFGKFLIGDHVDILAIDFDKKLIEEWIDDNVTRDQSFKVVPV